MNKRKLGRTNLLVSELSLNGEKFGLANDETTAFALLDTYYASGGNFLQSVGSTVRTDESRSEEIIGRWRETRRIDRDRLVLASRINFTRPSHGGSIAFVNSIREATERSLRRLRTNHLDLLVCAWNEHLAPIDDLLEAMDMLIRAGCVRYTAAGGFPSWRMVDSIHRSGLHNQARLEALQAEYSLASRAGREPEAIAMCREHRLGFLADSPLAGGFLARRPVSLRELLNLDRSWHEARFGGNIGDPMLKVLAEIADRRSATPAQIALAWVLQNPYIAAAVITPLDVRELTELVRAAAIVLSAKEMTALAKATAPQVPQLEYSHI